MENGVSMSSRVTENLQARLQPNILPMVANAEIRCFSPHNHYSENSSDPGNASNQQIRIKFTSGKLWPHDVVARRQNARSPVAVICNLKVINVQQSLKIFNSDTKRPVCITVTSSSKKTAVACMPDVSTYCHGIARRDGVCAARLSCKSQYSPVFRRVAGPATARTAPAILQI